MRRNPFALSLAKRQRILRRGRLSRNSFLVNQINGLEGGRFWQTAAKLWTVRDEFAWPGASNHERPVLMA